MVACVISVFSTVPTSASTSTPGKLWRVAASSLPSKMACRWLWKQWWPYRSSPASLSRLGLSTDPLLPRQARVQRRVRAHLVIALPRPPMHGVVPRVGQRHMPFADQNRAEHFPVHRDEPAKQARRFPIPQPRQFQRALLQGNFLLQLLERGFAQANAINIELRKQLDKRISHRRIVYGLKRVNIEPCRLPLQRPPGNLAAGRKPVALVERVRNHDGAVAVEQEQWSRILIANANSQLNRRQARLLQALVVAANDFDHVPPQRAGPAHQKTGIAFRFHNGKNDGIAFQEDLVRFIPRQQQIHGIIKIKTKVRRRIQPQLDQ